MRNRPGSVADPTRRIHVWRRHPETGVTETVDGGCSDDKPRADRRLCRRRRRRRGMTTGVDRHLNRDLKGVGDRSRRFNRTAVDCQRGSTSDRKRIVNLVLAQAQICGDGLRRPANSSHVGDRDEVGIAAPEIAHLDRRPLEHRFPERANRLLKLDFVPARRTELVGRSGACAVAL